MVAQHLPSSALRLKYNVLVKPTHVFIQYHADSDNHSAKQSDSKRGLAVSDVGLESECKRLRADKVRLSWTLSRP